MTWQCSKKVEFVYRLDMYRCTNERVTTIGLRPTVENAAPVSGREDRRASFLASVERSIAS